MPFGQGLAVGKVDKDFFTSLEEGIKEKRKRRQEQEDARAKFENDFITSLAKVKETTLGELITGQAKASQEMDLERYKQGETTKRTEMEQAGALERAKLRGNDDTQDLINYLNGGNESNDPVAAKIQELRSGGMQDSQIKQFMIEAGYNPAKYGL